MQFFTAIGQRGKIRASVIQHKAECPPKYSPEMSAPTFLQRSAYLILQLTKCPYCLVTFIKLCLPFLCFLSFINTFSPQFIITSYLPYLPQLIQYKDLIYSCSERFHIFFRKDGSIKGQANHGNLALFIKCFRTASSIFIAE